MIVDLRQWPDITTPAVWTEGRVELIDLDLDVRRRDGCTWAADEWLARCP